VIRGRIPIIMRNLPLLARIIGIAVLTGPLAGCTDEYDLEISGAKTYWLVGDTARLVALEWVQRPYATREPSLQSSTQAPQDYGWASSDSLVMRVIGNGVVVMASPGTAVLTVRSVHASTRRTMVVTPRPEPESPR
jgi:hypothetical protein